MADQQNGAESEEISKITEADKFKLFKELEVYPCLWDSSTPEYKNRQLKTAAMETLSNTFNMAPYNLKKILHTLRSAVVREIKKEQEGQASKWKFFKTVSYMKDEVMRSLKAKEEKEWSDEEIEDLIDYYKVNEQLWNHTLPSYKDRSLRELNYKKIGEILPGRSQDDIKKQWSILKTIFYRENKREEGSKVSGTSTDDVYKSQWKFYQQMMFIKGSDDVDPAVSTLEDSKSIDDRPPTKKHKAEKTKNAEEIKLELFKEAITFLKSPLPASEQVAGNSRVPDVAANDEISLFVRSIELTLRRMSGRQLALARKRINDVMFEVEMEAFAQQVTPFTASTSAASHTDLQGSYSTGQDASPFSANQYNWSCNSINMQ